VPDGISAWFDTANRFQTSGGAAREIEMDENNQRVVFVYTTHPSVVEAERIGRELVRLRQYPARNGLAVLVAGCHRTGRGCSGRRGGFAHVNHIR
jgi:hypothetical protein